MPIPSLPDPSLARHDEGFLKSRDGMRLYWQRYTPPRPLATVVVVHGAGDHSGRYPGLVAALVCAGLTAALVDLRGHGQSDGTRWHVERFGEYLDDLDAVVLALRRPSSRPSPMEKLFLVGHSQGGLIAALWALSHGTELAGLVLSAPFFALPRPPPLLKRVAGHVLGAVAPRLHVAAGLEVAELSSDPDVQRWTERDPLYLRAATPRWFAEVKRAQAEALRRAPELEAPLLVLGAGADTVADTAVARAFWDAVRSPDKKFELYDGFRHELFNEVARAVPISSARSWIIARAGARPESR
jgi:alpha-beta hydrolase superfamily lysophospholipase